MFVLVVFGSIGSREEYRISIRLHIVHSGRPSLTYHFARWQHKTVALQRAGLKSNVLWCVPVVGCLPILVVIIWRNTADAWVLQLHDMGASNTHCQESEKVCVKNCPVSQSRFSCENFTERSKCGERRSRAGMQYSGSSISAVSSESSAVNSANTMDTSLTAIGDDSISNDSNVTLEFVMDDENCERIKSYEEEEEFMEKLRCENGEQVSSASEPQCTNAISLRTVTSTSRTFEAISGACSSTPMAANKRAPPTIDSQNGMLMHFIAICVCVW